MRKANREQPSREEAHKRGQEQQICEAEEIIRRQAEKINAQEEVIRTQAEKLDAQQEELGQYAQQIEDLGGQMEQLCEQVEKLQDHVKKNSSNSSLPPSSDRFARQKKNRSLRQKSGKKPGGQKGHEGRTLQQVADPDVIVVHAVEACDYCRRDLGGVESLRQERRQVINLPVKRTVVTEHQNQSKCCPRCQTITVAPFPVDVKAPVHYGADMQAAAVYLVCQQLQPIARTSEIFSDLFDCPMSGGSIQAMVDRCAACLKGVEEQIKQALIKAKVIHNDETGCYVAGARWWLHSCSTETLTHDAVHVKRGRDATDAIGILPAFTGISIHDGWTTYWGYSNCQHGLCNVHHLRELKYFAVEKQEAWAADLMHVLLEMKEAVEQAKAAGRSCLEPQMRQELLIRDHAAIQAGYAAHPPVPLPAIVKRGKHRQSKARNLLDRLSKHQYSVLRFLDDFAVPFDNNLAERDIRMVKVKQKISGCFRSETGAQAFARIRGYLSTLRKQGQHLLLSLEMALVGHPLFPAGLCPGAISP
jgi:transposase